MKNSALHAKLRLNKKLPDAEFHHKYQLTKSVPKTHITGAFYKNLRKKSIRQKIGGDIA